MSERTIGKRSATQVQEAPTGGNDDAVGASGDLKNVKKEEGGGDQGKADRSIQPPSQLTVTKGNRNRRGPPQHSLPVSTAFVLVPLCAWH